MGVQPVRRLWHERNAGKAGECLAVTKRNRATLLNAKIQYSELPAPNAGQYITQPVVVARLRVLVSDTGIARLGGPEASLVYPFRVMGDQHAAARCGDDLIAVEGVDSHIPECPGRRSLVQRTHCFGGVLDHGDSVFAASMEDRAHIGTLAI